MTKTFIYSEGSICCPPPPFLSHLACESVEHYTWEFSITCCSKKTRTLGCWCQIYIWLLSAGGTWAQCIAYKHLWFTDSMNEKTSGVSRIGKELWFQMKWAKWTYSVFVSFILSHICRAKWFWIQITNKSFPKTEKIQWAWIWNMVLDGLRHYSVIIIENTNAIKHKLWFGTSCPRRNELRRIVRLWS